MPRKIRTFEAITIDLDELTPHPRNYREHPDDQIEHLAASLREHGFYRNVVIARDNTILAGHGICQAARLLGMQEVPAIRLAIAPNSVRALKILAADNETARLAMPNDRALTELLMEISERDELLGTGYDDARLAALLFVSRPASEIATIDEAAHWVGLPEYDGAHMRSSWRIYLHFVTVEDRLRFAEMAGLEPKGEQSNVWALWWPRPPDREYTIPSEWIVTDGDE